MGICLISPEEVVFQKWLWFSGLSRKDCHTAVRRTFLSVDQMLLFRRTGMSVVQMLSLNRQGPSPDASE